MTWMDEYEPPIEWRARELEDENKRLRAAVERALWFVERYKLFMPEIEDGLHFDKDETAEEEEIVAEHEAELTLALGGKHERSDRGTPDLREVHEQEVPDAV